MADDIVTRLRDHEHCDPECVTMEAADEIERLRAEIERLRAAVDSLLADIDTDHKPDETGRLCRTCGAGDGSWPCVHRGALDELKEARRG